MDDDLGPKRNQNIHFVLIPLMSPGHLIPMIDMAKLLAQHGVAATIVTTPLNAARFASAAVRRFSVEFGLEIGLHTVEFPSLEAGLPEGCENVDGLSGRSLIKNFFEATHMLRKPVEDLLRKLCPPPSCIVSGKNLGWTADTCKRLGVPRIFFDGMGCFASLCTSRLEDSRAHEGVHSRFEAIQVPGLPHKIELSIAKLPESLGNVWDMAETRDKMRAGEGSADGVVVNTFAELELEYVEEYKKVKGARVWCIGPVSGCNVSALDKSERGGSRTASVVTDKCLAWLDKREERSVIYACLGSICGLNPSQLKELGLGLESSKKPFLWVIREGEKSESLMKWIVDEGFHERTKKRGLVIKGWAPQLAILSHPAVGGFLTHCGWNSMLEGVAAGLPLATCPLFAEQFMNEKLAVQVLGVGVSVGVEEAVTWGLEDNSGLVMRSEGVRVAIHKVLGNNGHDDEECVKRRNKANELCALASRALQKGGSSYVDIELMIDYVREQRKNECLRP